MVSACSVAGGVSAWRSQLTELPTAAVGTLAGSAGVPGAADGAGAAAGFCYPRGVALSRDGGFALVADEANHRLRRIDRATGEVATVAGSGRSGWADGVGGAAEFRGLVCVALSADGTFALVGDGNLTLRRVELATGQVVTVAGSPDTFGDRDGAGSAARFRLISGLALSADGRFALVSQAFSPVIRRVELATGQVDSPHHLADALFPTGIALSQGGDFAVVLVDNSLRRIDLRGGQITLLAGNPDQPGGCDGAGLAARFARPQGVALSADGRWALVGDTKNHALRLVDLTTGLVSTLAGSAGQRGYRDGSGDQARFNAPAGVALSADGRLALVADYENHVIRQITLTRERFEF